MSVLARRRDRRCPLALSRSQTLTRAPAHFLRRLPAFFFSSAWPRFVHTP
ncbi:hypothetical protein ACR6C2_25455 [Streptomyces sp. INA 01156]